MIVFVFALGAMVGSFINVLVLRMGTGQSFVRGRSKCFSCSRPLGPLELLPILGFFIVRGRCRSCRSAISWQYPLVEVATAAMFALIYWRESAITQFLYYAAVFSLLMALSVYDFRHKIIPDEFVYPFIALAFAHSISFAHIAAGVALFAFFWALWFASRGRWMGFGDAKVALGIGLLLGPVQGATAVIFGFWIGALVGLALIAVRKSLTLKSEIPFAPFLAIGTFLAFFFDARLF